MKPLFVRRLAFVAVGGWNLEYSAPGEPAPKYEWELGLRMWLSGYSVGVYWDGEGFHEPASDVATMPKGTKVWEPGLRKRNAAANQRRIAAMYAENARTIRKAVDSANAELRRKRP